MAPVKETGMNTRYRQTVNSETIYNDLLDKIINLKYEPGEGISENELCEIYGATRHAIRGALAILKEKGFIEVLPQRGTYVSLIDLKRIDDILFLREAVEQETLHEIMKFNDKKSLIESLKACLEKQRAVKNPVENMIEFYKLDDEFHGIMLDAIGKKSVQRLYADEMLHMRRWRNLEVSALKRIANLPEEHKAIIDAIEADEEEKARKLMGIHIDSVGKFGMEMVKTYPHFFNE